MSEHVTTESLPGVAVLRMCRPEKKNALTFAMYTALIDGLGQAAADPDVRAAVLLGTDSVFTAGNDIGDFVKAASTGADMSPPIRFLHALAEFPKPLVAGVSGVAIGIGTTLLLHCDLVYADASARFKTPFVDLGLTPEGGSSLLLPALLGQRGAAEWLLLGDEFGPEQARAAGLVNAVVASASEAALAAARRLADKPGAALVEAKRLMKRASAAAITEAINLEAEVFAARLRSPEAMAAFMAFRRK
ncbi:MAG: enoyl-CoA hydratase/isomerase family protein [Myxococcales bacterium]|nr:enoyl-CoA hydratase/isomerase family protein [Myxococcales bacterium]